MPYKICSNCVMDSSDSSITFDEKGFCDHCNTFYSRTLPAWNIQKNNKNSLKILTNKIKKAGKGKEFDCIIGMSGGIDSSYLTYLASKVMKLRVLVFHVDGGWNSQIAVNNIEKIVDGLKLDLYTEVINWEEMKDSHLWEDKIIGRTKSAVAARDISPVAAGDVCRHRCRVSKPPR